MAKNNKPSASTGTAPEDNKEAMTSGRVVLWLPIILALISFATVFVQTVAPSFLSSLFGGPNLPTKTSDINQTVSTVIGDTDCRVIQELMMCFGKSELAGGSTHVRDFRFKFARPFKGRPTITTSIDVKSTGYAFAVYNSSLDEMEYNGGLVEIEFRKNPSPVTMSYIAIGRPGN